VSEGLTIEKLTRMRDLMSERLRHPEGELFLINAEQARKFRLSFEDAIESQKPRRLRDDPRFAPVDNTVVEANW